MKLTVLISTTALVLSANMSFAKGGDDSSKPPTPTATTLDCNSGQVAVKGTISEDSNGLRIVEVQRLLKKVSYPVDDTSTALGSIVEVCVDPAAQSFNDQEIYDYVREVAYAGQYDRALDLLALAPNQSDPGILTYYGFVNRKLGNQVLADDYYLKAIAGDENNITARSYYGQGLFSQGKKEAALEQLTLIEASGGKDTWAYTSLQDVINGADGYSY
ncbi:MAG: hypothetical protein AAF198_08915 [Pseudomonadota bacterium]